MDGANDATINSLAGVAAMEQSMSLHRFVARWVPNPHDAEDIVQNVWMQVVRGMNEKVTMQNVEACLIQSAKWEIFDYWRRQSKDRSLVEWTDDMEQLLEDEMPANSESISTEDPEEKAYRSQLLRRMEAQIKQMSATRASCMFLHLRGWSSPQIAERLNIKEKTVRQHICRGRKVLNELYFEENL